MQPTRSVNDIVLQDFPKGKFVVQNAERIVKDNRGIPKVEVFYSALPRRLDPDVPDNEKWDVYQSLNIYYADIKLLPLFIKGAVIINGQVIKPSKYLREYSKRKRVFAIPDTKTTSSLKFSDLVKPSQVFYPGELGDNEYWVYDKENFAQIGKSIGGELHYSFLIIPKLEIARRLFFRSSTGTHALLSKKFSEQINVKEIRRLCKDLVDDGSLAQLEIKKPFRSPDRTWLSYACFSTLGTKMANLIWESTTLSHINSYRSQRGPIAYPGTGFPFSGIEKLIVYGRECTLKDGRSAFFVYEIEDVIPDESPFNEIQLSLSKRKSNGGDGKRMPSKGMRYIPIISKRSDQQEMEGNSTIPVSSNPDPNSRYDDLEFTIEDGGFEKAILFSTSLNGSDESAAGGRKMEKEVDDISSSGENDNSSSAAPMSIQGGLIAENLYVDPECQEIKNNVFAHYNQVLDQLRLAGLFIHTFQTGSGQFDLSIPDLLLGQEHNYYDPAWYYDKNGGKRELRVSELRYSVSNDTVGKEAFVYLFQLKAFKAESGVQDTLMAYPKDGQKREFSELLTVVKLLAKHKGRCLSIVKKEKQPDADFKFTCKRHFFTEHFENPKEIDGRLYRSRQYVIPLESRVNNIFSGIKSFIRI